MDTKDQVTVALAEAAFSGSPLEVIYLIPPIIKKNNPSTNITFVIPTINLPNTQAAMSLAVVISIPAVNVVGQSIV